MSLHGPPESSELGSFLLNANGNMAAPILLIQLSSRSLQKGRSFPYDTTVRRFASMPNSIKYCLHRP